MRALLRLRELILSGEFEPGERMSELPLVERLGVSRTPLRLALAELEHEGLLRGLEGGGYVVREFTREDISDAIELRGVLEGTAARFAAERGAGRAAIRTLSRINDEIGELVHKVDYDSFVRYVDLNERFHACMLKIAHSPMLERALEGTHLAAVRRPERVRAGRGGAAALPRHPDHRPSPSPRTDRGDRAPPGRARRGAWRASTRGSR